MLLEHFCKCAEENIPQRRLKMLCYNQDRCRRRDKAQPSNGEYGQMKSHFSFTHHSLRPGKGRDAACVRKENQKKVKEKQTDALPGGSAAFFLNPAIRYLQTISKRSRCHTRGPPLCVELVCSPPLIIFKGSN